MQRTKDIALAARRLKDGGLVAFATETVYGLGADACNDRAVAAIYEAKGRPSFNPLIVHVNSVEAAQQLGDFTPAARDLAQAFWPGPLTLVVPRAANCRVSRLASAGLDSLALRIPAHDQARALLDEFGGPVVAPSANPSGKISSTRPEHVLTGFADHEGLVLDGGNCAIGVESTIVSCLGAAPAILRAGGLVAADIRQVCPNCETNQHNNTSVPVAPGQLLSHYAPDAPVRLNVEKPQADEAFLAFGTADTANPQTLNLSPSGNLGEAAGNLFAMLHRFDEMGVEKIAVAPIPETGLGRAINDRLRRAAAPRP